MPDPIEFGPVGIAIEAIFYYGGTAMCIVTLPIYIIVVAVLFMSTKRQTGTSGSFYRIYMIGGIVDIAAMLNNHLLSIMPAHGFFLNFYLSSIHVGQMWTARNCIIANIIQIAPAIFMGALLYTSEFSYETNWLGGRYCVFADPDFQRVYFSIASTIQTTFVFYIVINYVVVFRSFRRQLRQVKSDESSSSREKKKQEDRLLYISIVVCLLEIGTWIFSLYAFVIYVDIPLRLFYMIFNILYDVYACTPPYLLIFFSTPFQQLVRSFLRMTDMQSQNSVTGASSISVQRIGIRNHGCTKVAAMISLVPHPFKNTFYIIVFLIFIPFAASFNNDPEERLDLRGIIERWDYPVEIHEVTTKDGYILDLHRIPRGQNESKSSGPCNRPAILLNHGIASSGAQWALNLPNQSAAFVFADAGFDVYLANHRGTTYGKKHVNKGTGLFSDFWQFTLDEMANFDLPAIIDKVLELNGNTQLYYVGHSQGNLVGFLTLADNPQYNKKVKKLFALTPVGAAHYARGATQFAYLAHNVFRPVTAFYTSVLGPHELFFNIPWLFRLVGELVCKNPPLNYICKDLIEISSGPTGPHSNMTRTPVYFSHFPAGTSTWTFLHYTQNSQAKKAMHFDYGNALKNLQKHGRVSIHAFPHPYNYSNIDTELYLCWSRNDWLATPADIEKILVPSLRSGIIKGSFEINEYNHIAFALATTTKDRVYRPIIDIILKNDPLPMCVDEACLYFPITGSFISIFLEPFLLCVDCHLLLFLLCHLPILQIRLTISERTFPSAFDGRRIDKTFERLGKDQAGFYTVFMPFPNVQITDYSILREAFIEKGDEFSGRPLNPLFQEAFTFAPNTGVIQSNGDTWREQRRAAISIMRDFGMGKNVMEELVRSSIGEFLEHLEKLPDKSNVDLYWPIKVLVSNVINEVLFGYRYNYDNCEPLMNYVNRFNAQKYPQINQYIVENVHRSLKEYNVDDEQTCFAHAYKQRMEENEHLNDLNLMSCCADFFVSGQERTATTLRWR
ncbi:hypothetical protein PRIPAC_82545 [Pristionchus pacificus]|uniref:G protein-coupled receptor n=1 Tax=Pristionchus pacificus TaxID=54126 RepID=A0A2A6C4F7_PRIPA|nr:hypothetical protein PRIPAC_82545 [Pristionchus pacificus]|eukprot:PDM73044.1 G protein-coupled receptor [Pristionchus pacificus]